MSIHNMAPAKRFDAEHRPSCSCCKRPRISTINRIHPLTTEQMRLCIDCYSEFLTAARLKRCGQRGVIQTVLELQDKLNNPKPEAEKV